MCDTRGGDGSVRQELAVAIVTQAPATTDSNGTTTFRDGSGRTTGTASHPRR